MRETDENPYSTSFKEKRGLKGKGCLSIAASDVSFQKTESVDRDAQALELEGHLEIGRSEFVMRNDQMGFSRMARQHAASIGAHVVLVESTGAKLQAIHVGPDGAIDMESVMADPPKSLQPRGHSVIRAVFLAKPS